MLNILSLLPTVNQSCTSCLNPPMLKKLIEFKKVGRLKARGTDLQSMLISRRSILQRYGRLAISFGLIAPAIVTSRKSLAQQPANHLCGKQTSAQMQGPFFIPLSPERINLVEPKMKAPRMRLTGLVVDTACRPIAGAMLDFWQCDEKGQYDTKGFSLRGHQYSNSKGEFFWKL